MDTLKVALEITDTIAWPLVAVFIAYGLLKAGQYLLPRLTQVKLPSDFEIRFNELSEKIEDIKYPQKIQEAINLKRDRLLKIPNVSFHYADRERISNFYNDYFREPTVENIVSEMASEVSADLKGQLPKVLEAKAGGKDLSKWISTIKLPETSLNGMFLRYQRETIKNNQVSIGLDIVDVELSELQDFEELVLKLEREFSLKIDDAVLAERRANLKTKTAERTLKKLENASGWVLVEGSFLISETDKDFYRCSYVHPISEYTAETGKQVCITFMVQKSSIEQHVSGNYIQSIGKEVPLRVYGEVWQPLNRKQDAWDLQITPLAVY